MGNNLSASLKGSPAEDQVSEIASLADSKYLCFVQYIYDYLPFEIKWLRPQPLSLWNILTELETYQTALKDARSKSEHSIRLDPKAGNLPIHTGLEDFRQNKYWQIVESATRELLELFARDPHCAKVMVSDKRSMSSLAEEQLKREVLNTYCRFSMYMFPDADQRRIELLAQCIVLIFVFDGRQSSHGGKCVSRLLQLTEAQMCGRRPPQWERLSSITVKFLFVDADANL